MNTYTIVFKRRFSNSEHRWLIKETETDFVVSRSKWFKSHTEMIVDLTKYLSWLLSNPNQ